MQAYTRLAAVTIAMAAAACADDPVTPTVAHAGHPPSPIAAAHQQPVDEVADRFRARLDIRFEVDGALAPAMPFAVHIEGTAVEDITSAEVSVALPTFDIMENGVVPGGKAPPVKVWTVGKLERGQEWKQRVDIDPIRDKGYYQMTVAVRGRASSYSCALSEGFADYAANIGSPYSQPWGSWENAYWPAPYHRGNGEVEGNVAALLHDLIDDENESGDRTELSPYHVARVLKTCSNSSGSINDTADFVWCLENRVDGGVHQNRFPGLSVPASPSSVRPAHWDADDIRSTWINTVG